MVESMEEGRRVARQVKLEGLVKELSTLSVKAPDGISFVGPPVLF